MDSKPALSRKSSIVQVLHVPQVGFSIRALPVPALSSVTQDTVSQTISDVQLQQPDNYLYVFTVPNDLLSIFDKYEIGSDLRTAVRHIRLCILTALSSASLTPTELNGGINGPSLAPHVDAWRSAFRHLPVGHGIRSIDFDMSCPGQAIEVRHIGRLLQHISTLANIKSSEKVQCSVSGCGDEARQKLKAFLVGGGNQMEGS
jgi:hypothetical protein